MIKDPITIDPDSDIEIAAQLIYKHKIGGMPVVKKGMLVGERAIFLENKDFKIAFEGGVKWEEAVKTVPKKGVASLYWYCTHLGKWSLIQGITTILGNKTRIYKNGRIKCARNS